MAKVTTRTATLYCDRCHRKGNPETPGRKVSLLFGASVTLPEDGWKDAAYDAGWWPGRSWHYCGPCAGVLGKVSQAQRAADQVAQP